MLNAEELQASPLLFPLDFHASLLSHNLGLRMGSGGIVGLGGRQAGEEGGMPAIGPILLGAQAKNLFPMLSSLSFP